MPKITLSFALFLLVACTPTEPPKSDKATVTDNYISWYVEHQSGDADLAGRLSQDFRDGWSRVVELLAEETPSGEIVALLKAEGISAFLLSQGIQQTEVPGGTASFLIMDRENGCEQIVREQWTATREDGPTSLILAGIGNEDVTGILQTEKQIHLAAFELPHAQEYVDIRTQSFSPFVKGVVVFVTVLLTSGCEPQRPAPVPVTPPPPPVCTCTITINSAQGSSSNYSYPVGPGGRAVNYPLGWNSNSAPNSTPSTTRGVEYVLRTRTGSCIPRQSKRDTFSYTDASTGQTVEQRAPAPNRATGDLGGHQSGQWASDGPASSALQVNRDGTISWIDIPGLRDVAPFLPVRKRAEYKVEAFDSRTNALACSSPTWTMDFGISGLRAWDPSPTDSLGGPYSIALPRF